MSDWIAFLFGIFVCGIIAAVLPLLALDYLYLNSPTRPPAAAFLAILVFGFIVGSWFMLRTLDRMFWHLSEIELIGGCRRKMRLPLSSLAKIVIGLPNKFPIPGMEKFAPPQIRETSMLLCFSDGSLLPMRLHGMLNGTLLMNKLLSHYADRVDKNYKYSEEEIKILRKADINVLIKRDHAQDSSLKH
jgi:hypothetical protein